jgi:signal transduction histidine kinase
MRRSFATRLSLTLVVLLLSYGACVGFIGRHVLITQTQESLQHVSFGLAKHMVEHWPQMTSAPPEQASRREREAVLSMLMVVNPGVQAYVLNEQGAVEAYIGEPGMVRDKQVDMQAIAAFLSGKPLPIYGSDPMGVGRKSVFSVAKFLPRTIANKPPGYLYIVLDGASRDAVAQQISSSKLWQGAVLAALLGLLLILCVGLFTFRRLTLPLHDLAQQLEHYDLSAGPVRTPLSVATIKHQASQRVNDEVDAMRMAFDAMKQRLASQTERERSQGKAHRDMMAGLAHDLRTPLTSLHGHLEALLDEQIDVSKSQRQGMLAIALSQSDKVRKLSQQLFELAMLQSTDELAHPEPFRLDELVSDAVQKFGWTENMPRVRFAGIPPGPLEVHGDFQLIERALINLIDNAVRHGGLASLVRVSVTKKDEMASILIEDDGPGLPLDVAKRLLDNQSLREPPIQRASGGIGGLGLAIAQRVAWLHGGSLKPLLGTQQGARVCLVLPLMS